MSGIDRVSPFPAASTGCQPKLTFRESQVGSNTTRKPYLPLPSGMIPFPLPCGLATRISLAATVFALGSQFHDFYILKCSPVSLDFSLAETLP